MMRLLVVEDEAVIALDLAQHLRGFGYDVVGTAASSERALQLALELRPDLILMDIVIRGTVDGIDTASQILKELDVPVVFLTAYSDAGTLERLRGVAPYGHVVKPFRPADLRSAIEVALQRHRLERQLANSERWLSSTLQCLGDGVVATDAQGRIKLMNGVAEQLLGQSLDDVLGLPVRDSVALLDSETDDPLADPVARTLASGQPSRLLTGRLRRPTDGRAVPVDVRSSPILDERQRLLGAVLVLRDVSERRRTEAALSRLALLDMLTGLPNRASLQPQVEVMASNARRTGRLLAVLFLDLDGFKQVNDSFGHGGGDEVLVQLARRLKDALRVEDFVARLGGDEFVVLAGNLASPEMASAVARKLIEGCAQPFVIDGQEAHVTMSVGISLCPSDTADAALLLRFADAAMYQAKARGRNQLALYGDVGASARPAHAVGAQPSVVAGRNTASSSG